MLLAVRHLAPFHATPSAPPLLLAAWRCHSSPDSSFLAACGPPFCQVPSRPLRTLLAARYSSISTSPSWPMATHRPPGLRQGYQASGGRSATETSTLTEVRHLRQRGGTYQLMNRISSAVARNLSTGNGIISVDGTCQMLSDIFQLMGGTYKANGDFMSSNLCCLPVMSLTRLVCQRGRLMVARQKGEPWPRCPLPWPRCPPLGVGICRLRGKILKLRGGTYQLEDDNIS